MTDMTVRLKGIRIPRPNNFGRIDTMNGTDVVTLGGTIYTDFTALNRAWEISWENMLYADYETIRNIYYGQVTNGYPYLSFPAYGIYTQVKLSISSAGLALNGVLIPKFSMTLREKTAVS